MTKQTKNITKTIAVVLEVTRSGYTASGVPRDMVRMEISSGEEVSTIVKGDYQRQYQAGRVFSIEFTRNAKGLVDIKSEELLTEDTEQIVQTSRDMFALDQVSNSAAPAARKSMAL